MIKNNKNQQLKKSFFFGLLLFFLMITSAFITYRQKNQPFINIKAQEDDPNFCQNHCQDPTCRSKPDFYDEECCLRIQQTGDPTQCPWPQRGWCMPEHCSTIPEGVNRQRCAAPRQAWCNLCKEHRCPGFVNEAPTPTPLIFPSPTIPTQEIIFSSPTPFIPTPSPITFPSETLPTKLIPINPSPLIISHYPIQPFKTTSPKNPSFSSEIINRLIVVKERTDTAIKTIQPEVKKYALKVKTIDRQLEETINQMIYELILKFFPFLFR